MYRSLLYVPAINRQFLEKAFLRGADAIILDLEDSVSCADKLAARDAVRSISQYSGYDGGKTLVRINGTDDLVRGDLAAVLTVDVAGIVLPKCKCAEDVDRIKVILNELGSNADIPIIALVETPEGVLKASEIARHKSVQALILGAEDYATSINAYPDRDVLFFPKQLVHLAAKGEGKNSYGLLQSIAQFDDLSGLQDAATEAKRFGFDGATCVHPAAVPILNGAFSPDENEVEWARRLIEYVENDPKISGAFRFENAFIDAPILARARRLIQSAS